MKIWIVLLSLISASFAHANSFVGNGGGQGDVELLVTLTQIQETFKFIAKKADEQTPLCQCNKTYSGRAICEPLKTLNDSQEKFCNASIYKVTPAMVELLQHRDSIHFNWTNEKMEVKEKGQLRAVDAVANREKRDVTINQPRFLAMTPAERVFLLSHELMHLTDLDGKPLEDRGAVGPFTGDDGARDLVNAMAAAASVVPGAYPKDVPTYKAKLSRSQAVKPVWFTLEFGSASPTGSYDDNFFFTNYSRWQTSVRYQWENIGVFASYRRETGDKNVLNSVTAHEDVDVFGVGLTYRFFPSSDPLTFWGQSHIMPHVALEYSKGTYTESEIDTFADTESTLGYSAGVSYYMPLFIGFWAYVDVSYEHRPFKYTINTNPQDTLNFNKDLFSGNIGVSYAF